MSKRRASRLAARRRAASHRAFARRGRFREPEIGDAYFDPPWWRTTYASRAAIAAGSVLVTVGALLWLQLTALEVEARAPGDREREREEDPESTDAEMRAAQGARR